MEQCFADALHTRTAIPGSPSSSAPARRSSPSPRRTGPGRCASSRDAVELSLAVTGRPDDRRRARGCGRWCAAVAEPSRDAAHPGCAGVVAAGARPGARVAALRRSGRPRPAGSRTRSRGARGGRRRRAAALRLVPACSGTGWSPRPRSPTGGAIRWRGSGRRWPSSRTRDTTASRRRAGRCCGRPASPCPGATRMRTRCPPPLRALGITARELEVLDLARHGLSNREIAERLYLSPRTVERHVANLTVKTGVERRAQLVAFAARAGTDSARPPRSWAPRDAELAALPHVRRTASRCARSRTAVQPKGDHDEHRHDADGAVLRCAPDGRAGPAVATGVRQHRRSRRDRRTRRRRLRLLVARLLARRQHGLRDHTRRRRRARQPVAAASRRGGRPGASASAPISRSGTSRTATTTPTTSSETACSATQGAELVSSYFTARMIDSSAFWYLMFLSGVWGEHLPQGYAVPADTFVRSRELWLGKTAVQLFEFTDSTTVVRRVGRRHDGVVPAGEGAPRRRHDLAGVAHVLRRRHQRARLVHPARATCATSSTS